MPEQPTLTEPRARGVAVIARGGAVQIAGQVAQRGFSFIFTFVAIRVLGKSPYGLYRQITQILTIAGQLGLAGFNYAAMRFVARARAQGRPEEVRGAARRSLAGAMTASLLVVGGLVALAPWLGRAFADDTAGIAEFSDYIRLGAVLVPLFALTQVLRYVTQGYKTMVPSVVTGNIVQPAARFILGVLFLLVGFGVAGAITSLWLATAVAAAVGAWYYTRILSPTEHAATPRAPAGMVRFALPQGGASLLGIQALGLPIILLGLYSTNAAAGLYGLALSMQGPGNIFLGGIVNIWAPVVSDLHSKGEIDRLDHLYKTINRWIATFSFPVLAVLVLEPDLFVRLFAGKEGAGAEPIIAVLALGNLFYTGTGPTGYVLSMTGRPHVNLINSLLSVGAFIGLGIWVIPRHGLLGMAVVDAVLTGLVNLARVVEAKLLVGVQPFGRSFLKPVVGTAFGAAAVLAWRLLPWDGTFSEIAALCVGAAVYLLTLKALGIDEEERFVLDQIKKRARKKKS